MPLLLVLLLRAKARWKLTPRIFRDLIILSTCNVLMLLALFRSYHTISAGMATTLHFVYPVFVLVGAALFCGERITPLKLLCLGLCMAGILCFYTPGQNTPFAMYYPLTNNLQAVPSYFGFAFD